MHTRSRSLYRRGPGRKPRTIRVPYIVARDAWRSFREPSSEPAIVYVGWHGNSNAGDDAIYEIFARRMADAGRGITGAPRAVSLKVAAALTRPRHANGVVLGGGTLIGVPEYRDVVRSLMEGGIGPVVTFGTGAESPIFYGDDAGLMEKELDLWAELLSSMSDVTVRGPLTAKALQDRGVDAEIVGDPALLVDPPGDTSAPDPEVVGINVGVNWGSWERDPNALLARMAVTARRLVSSGRRLRFLVLWKGDSNFIRELHRSIGSAGEIVTYDGDLDNMLRAIAGCDVIVAQKLHAAVFASALGVPAVMLEYHPKCRDFQSAIGRDDYTLRIDRATPDEVLELVERSSTNRTAEVARLLNAVTPLRNRLQATLDRAVTLFGHK